jgi:cytochrome c
MSEEPAGNAANGKKAFTRHCQSCHNMALKGKHNVGPTLGTIWGRKIASIAGFKFSSALASKKSETWDAAKLNDWLENPGGWAVGTNMAFAGVKNATERTDLIRYLYETHPKNKKK